MERSGDELDGAQDEVNGFEFDAERTWIVFGSPEASIRATRDFTEVCADRLCGERSCFVALVRGFAGEVDVVIEHGKSFRCEVEREADALFDEANTRRGEIRNDRRRFVGSVAASRVRLPVAFAVCPGHS